MSLVYLRRFGLPHGDAPGSRFDVLGKMVQLEETNVGIALATVRLGDEEMGHFLTQKSAKIRRVGYTTDHLWLSLDWVLVRFAVGFWLLVNEVLIINGLYDLTNSTHFFT